MTVLIEHKSGYRLAQEEALVADTLRAAGEPYEIAALSQLRRKRVDALSASLVVGTLDFVKAGLRHHGREMPLIPSYPKSLQPFLHRMVQPAKLRTVIERVLAGAGPVFVKPSTRTKRFTGFVLDESKIWRLNGVPLGEPVWWSEPVIWKSEWRIYVVRGGVRHISHYDGAVADCLDLGQVEQAVQVLANDPEAPRSYAIDFGVLGDGTTALVEMNDALGIGAYSGIDGPTYLEMLQDRWNQLTS